MNCGLELLNLKWFNFGWIEWFNLVLSTVMWKVHAFTDCIYWLNLVSRRYLSAILTARLHSFHLLSHSSSFWSWVISKLNLSSPAMNELFTWPWLKVTKNKVEFLAIWSVSQLGKCCHRAFSRAFYPTSSAATERTNKPSTSLWSCSRRSQATTTSRRRSVPCRASQSSSLAYSTTW